MKNFEKIKDEIIVDVIRYKELYDECYIVRDINFNFSLYVTGCSDFEFLSLMLKNKFKTFEEINSNEDIFIYNDLNKTSKKINDKVYFSERYINMSASVKKLDSIVPVISIVDFVGDLSNVIDEYYKKYGKILIIDLNPNDISFYTTGCGIIDYLYEINIKEEAIIDYSEYGVNYTNNITIPLISSNNINSYRALFKKIDFNNFRTITTIHKFINEMVKIHDCGAVFILFGNNFDNLNMIKSLSSELIVSLTQLNETIYFDEISELEEFGIKITRL